MSNLNSNRVDATLTSAEVTTIVDQLNSIASSMPFLIGLTVEERINIPKMNVANRQFAQDCMDVLTNNPTLFPPFLDITLLTRDLELFDRLNALKIQIGQLLEKVDDTRMLAGSEAYISALSVYRIVQAAATAGMPGADVLGAELKARFDQVTANP